MAKRARLYDDVEIYDPYIGCDPYNTVDAWRERVWIDRILYSAERSAVNDVGDST